MKDSIQLANMLRRFSREKEEIRKKHIPGGGGLPPRPNAARAPHGNNNNNNAAAAAPPGATPKVAGGNDFMGANLTPDPTVLSLLGAASDNTDMLQDLMGDLDFAMLDSPGGSPGHGENGMGAGLKAVGGGVTRVLSSPPLPGGLSAPLIKRIEDLRAVRIT